MVSIVQFVLAIAVLTIIGNLPDGCTLITPTRQGGCIYLYHA